MKTRQQLLNERGQSFICAIKLYIQHNIDDSEQEFAMQRLESFKTYYESIERKNKDDLIALNICLSELLRDIDPFTIKNQTSADKIRIEYEALASKRHYLDAPLDYEVTHQEGSQQVERHDQVMVSLTPEQTKPYLYIFLDPSHPKFPAEFKGKTHGEIQLLQEAVCQWLNDSSHFQLILEEKNRTFNALGMFQENAASFKTVEDCKRTVAILTRDDSYERFDALANSLISAEMEEGVFYQSVPVRGADAREAKGLGAYLGMSVSTLRTHPDQANEWVVNAQISKNLSFRKIRSAFIVPFDLLDKGCSKEELTAITARNIRHQVALAMISAHKEGQYQLDKSFPFLLQNLMSLPLQPEEYPWVAEDILMKAVQQVQAELSDSNPKALRDLYRDIGLYDPSIDAHFLNAALQHPPQVFFTHRPVNSVRGLVRGLGLRSAENKKQIKKTATYFQAELAKIAQHLDNMGEDSRELRLIEVGETDSEFANRKRLVLLEQAIKQHEQLKSRSTGFMALFKRATWNPPSERAALEQIIFDQLHGRRAGSCASGKDREEMETFMPIVMLEIFEEYGQFPPPPGSKPVTGPNGLAVDLRAVFEDKMAQALVQSYGPKISGLNAPGSEGLKNVIDVLGVNIIRKADKLAVEQSVVEPGVSFHKETDFAAGLNKPSLKGINKLFKRIAYAFGFGKIAKQVDEMHTAMKKALSTPAESTAQPSIEDDYASRALEAGRALNPQYSEGQDSKDSPKQTSRAKKERKWYRLNRLNR